MPQRRMNSIERELSAVARGWSGRPVALLDEQTGRAAHAEIDGERKPDRTAADDQDRSFQCWTG